MSSPIESLLEHDHESLGQLLIELDTALATHNFPGASELLDLFWARLAIHIRAENLHLFPALANAPLSLFSGQDGLPTREEAHSLLLRLRSDHDFFMKELAELMKRARTMRVDQASNVNVAKQLRLRLVAIGKRLEAHNRLEEERVYVWPALLFDESTAARLCERLRHELENLPPRFSDGFGQRL
jgi:iron-sulfur cluster repair protein YtfE (RIC family)